MSKSILVLPLFSSYGGLICWLAGILVLYLEEILAKSPLVFMFGVLGKLLVQQIAINSVVILFQALA